LYYPKMHQVTLSTKAGRGCGIKRPHTLLKPRL